MSNRSKKFRTKIDEIASSAVERWSKRVRDTHFRGVYVIFFRTENGVAQIVLPFSDVRGTYSARYASLVAQTKLASSRHLSARAVEKRLFDASANFFRNAIEIHRKELKADCDQVQLENYRTVIGKYLLKERKEPLPKKGGLLFIMLCYDNEGLVFSSADVFNPKGKDTLHPFETLIDVLMYLTPAIYSALYELKGFDVKEFDFP